MKIKLDISPCPNDTFIFYAMLHGAIDCEGLAFDVDFHDISALNSIATEAKGDIIKVSSAVLANIMQQYDLLPCGGAMGYGNGPILVSKQKIHKAELYDATVAIPGFDTTANMLLDRTLGEVKAKREYLFSDIAEAVESGEVDAGVLIHEGRFTYQKMGLKLVADLGELWHEQTGLPIVLGVIVCRNDLPQEVKAKIGRIIRRSVEYAMKNPQKTHPFVKAHAQELESEVLEKHISYFVNDFTLDMGSKGIDALKKLVEIDDFGTSNG